MRKVSALSTTYSPEKPVGREDEVNRIAEAVRPLLRNQVGENLLIYGPAGIGKSTCVEHVFEVLEDQGRVRTVSINCWQYNSRASLLTELLIQLGYPAPRKGKPVDELLSKLREWLDKNRSVVLLLDEFDQLESASEIVYDLELLNREAENSLGLVMISNRPPEELYLDPRSRSRLNCRTLRFDPYSIEQLVSILEDRVEQAFYPGSVSSEVIRFLATKTADQSGDCRDALRILLQSARKAEKDGEKKLSQEYIEGELG